MAAKASNRGAYVKKTGYDADMSTELPHKDKTRVSVAFVP